MAVKRYDVGFLAVQWPVAYTLTNQSWCGNLLRSFVDACSDAHILLLVLGALGRLSENISRDDKERLYFI